MNKEKAIKTLNSVLEELQITSYELSKKLGMNRPQGLYDVLNPDKKVGVSKKLAEKIVSAYPQFNITWLLTGDGSMLKNDSDTTDINIDYKEKYYNLLEENRELRIELDVLKKRLAIAEAAKTAIAKKA